MAAVLVDGFDGFSIAAAVAVVEFARVDQLPESAFVALAVLGVVAGETGEVGGAALHDLAEQFGLVGGGLVGMVVLEVVPLEVDGVGDESRFEMIDAQKPPVGVGHLADEAGFVGVGRVEGVLEAGKMRVEFGGIFTGDYGSFG